MDWIPSYPLLLPLSYTYFQNCQVTNGLVFCDGNPLGCLRYKVQFSKYKHCAKLDMELVPPALCLSTSWRNGQLYSLTWRNGERND